MADGNVTDALEQAVLSAWEADKPIEARRLAEERIAADPESLVGHYVLGLVLYRENGDLSRAYAELERTEEIWTSKYAAAPDHPWKVHADLLVALADVAGDMDDRETELEWLDAHDAGYDPDRLAEHGWPLMKLGRYDEAREWAQRGIDSGDVWQGVVGRNTLCAIAGESADREAAYTACKSSYEQLPSGYDPVVAQMNASSPAVGVLKFDEAEELLAKATTGSADTAANPWSSLVWHYLAQGRGADAVTAVKGMQHWRSRQPPQYRDQSRADLDMTLAAVYFVAGDGERALATIDRALDFPDRHGTNSSSQEQSRGGNALLRLAMRRLQQREAHETAQSKSILGRLWYGLWRRVPGWDDWVDRSAVTASLTDSRRLRSTLRIYVDGGLYTPPWLVGELVPILGPGVVEAEIERFRDDPQDTILAPYQDAVLAECAWWRGSRGETDRLAEQALAGLPEPEKLLRARLLAIRGDLAWKSGDTDEAFSHYELAMQLDPGAVRRLGLALPAEVELAGGGDAAVETAAILGRSPSLATGWGGFRVVVSGGSTVEVCLSSPSGARLSCSTTAAPEEATSSDHARAAALAFHRAAFGLPLGASGLDLGSLDGTNTVQSEKMRDEMRGMLENLEKTP